VSNLTSLVLQIVLLVIIAACVIISTNAVTVTGLAVVSVMFGIALVIYLMDL